MKKRSKLTIAIGLTCIILNSCYSGNSNTNTTSQKTIQDLINHANATSEGLEFSCTPKYNGPYDCQGVNQDLNNLPFTCKRKYQNQIFSEASFHWIFGHGGNFECHYGLNIERAPTSIWAPWPVTGNWQRN